MCRVLHKLQQSCSKATEVAGVAALAEVEKYGQILGSFLSVFECPGHPKKYPEKAAMQLLKNSAQG